MIKIKLLKPDEEHLSTLRQSVETWNRWRNENPGICPDLNGTDLRGINLSFANLRFADLSVANFKGSNLSFADLKGSNLSFADLSGVNFRFAKLGSADLSGADLNFADLTGADLTGADLSDVMGLTEADKENLKALGAIFENSSEKATTNDHSDVLNFTSEVSKDFSIDEVAADLDTVLPERDNFSPGLGTFYYPEAQ